MRSFAGAPFPGMNAGEGSALFLSLAQGATYFFFALVVFALVVFVVFALVVFALVVFALGASSAAAGASACAVSVLA